MASSDVALLAGSFLIWFSYRKPKIRSSSEKGKEKLNAGDRQREDENGNEAAQI